MDGSVEGGKGGAGVGVVLEVVYFLENEHLKIRNVSPGEPNQAMVGGC